MDLTLNSPVRFIPKVGPAMAGKLEKLGIFTVRDFLWYPPFRYNDFSHTSPIGRLRPDEIVTIRGEVTSFVNLLTKSGKKMQVATIEDDSGKIEIIWFNQPYLLSVIRKGTTLNIAGTVQFFIRKLAMMSPDYEIVDPDSTGSLHTGRIVPVYPETAGVSSKWLRGRISYLLGLGLLPDTDYLPPEITAKHGFMNLTEAVNNLHFPKSPDLARRAKERLSYDELFLLQLIAKKIKKDWETTQKSPVIKFAQSESAKFRSALPFTLTTDQTEAIDKILADLSRPYPMNRLLEGDVGAGKTVVAAAAMYAAYRAGYQSVLMAPTQILAQQHYQSIKTLFDKFSIPVELVTGETNRNKLRIRKIEDGKSKMETKKQLVNKKNPSSAINHPLSILIGTHALLSESAIFNHVGLVIVDEQQRFGVSQRQLLKDKSGGEITPHLLTMTATPIPRTIALAIWGNLDISIINQMPVGRQPVKTWVVPEEKRPNAYTWIKNEIRSNQSQAFIVCPLIEDSETLETVKSVKKEYELLKSKIFPEFSVALLHGKLKSGEKTAILSDFRNKKFDILVATPVVEVGIDIPDATIMMIEAADRFGLSQLHQLRGRVGRRQAQSYCLLFTDNNDENVIKRLKALETVHSGPQLAEIDLAIRGPGELFGTRQHGLPQMKFASIMNLDLVEMTHQDAVSVLESDPGLSKFLPLREIVENSKIHGSSQD